MLWTSTITRLRICRLSLTIQVWDKLTRCSFFTIRCRTSLARAVDAGFADVGQLLADPDLESIRAADGFRAVLETLENRGNSETGETPD